MLDIFYNVWGGFANHLIFTLLSVLSIYILGFILFFISVILWDVFMLTKEHIIIIIFSAFFTMYSSVVKIYIVIVIISGLVALFT